MGVAARQYIMDEFSPHAVAQKQVEEIRVRAWLPPCLPRPALCRQSAMLKNNKPNAGLNTSYNNNNKRPLTPKSMPPAGDEHAKLKT